MACGDVVLFHGRLLHKGSRCVGRRRRASVPVVATPRRVPPGCFRVWCYVDLEFRVTRGRSPADQTAFRHVLASHYIPRSYGFWPPLWVRPPPPLVTAFLCATAAALCATAAVPCATTAFEETEKRR